MMTISQTIDRQTQLRKAAVLVSTLGEPLAEQLLADLPEHDAEEVRLLVATLDGIGQQELEDLLADLQNPGLPVSDPIEDPMSTTSGGVELDASLLARLEADDDLDSYSSPPVRQDSWKAISDADAEVLVEILAAEQPQTIAVVLAHVEPSQAAELISRLPTAMQAESLTRLSELDPADERSLQVVEAQLANWINARQQHQQRISAGRELVDKILQHTPNNQREVLLAKLGRHKREPTVQGSSPAVASQSINLGHATSAYAEQASVGAESLSITPATTAAPLLDSAEVLQQLESLDDQSLLKALQSVDRRTVMIALAGASDALMKRIVKGLPRRQANQFRQQVRTIGPTRLTEMVAAQQELIRCGQI